MVTVERPVCADPPSVTLTPADVPDPNPDGSITLTPAATGRLLETLGNLRAYLESQHSACHAAPGGTVDP